MIGADFVRGHPSCLILGDNILYGHGLPDALRRADARTQGSTIFSYWVEDPQRYGVIEFDGEDRGALDRREAAKSEIELGGDRLYFYDEEVVDLVKELKPSARSELEITDLNLLYMRERRLSVERLGRGFAWFDAGTHDSLLEAAEFVRVLQRRQGQLVCSPDEIAFHNGWVDAERTEAARRESGQDAICAAAAG